MFSECIVIKRHVFKEPLVLDDVPLLTFMLYRKFVFLISCIYAMTSTNIARDASLACTSDCTLNSVTDSSGSSKDVFETTSRTKSRKNDAKFSPHLGARKKISSSISAIKRGASAISSSVSDLTKAANATLNEKLQTSHKSSEPKTKRPSIPDFQTKLTKRLNASFKPKKNTVPQNLGAQAPPSASRASKLPTEKLLASSKSSLPKSKIDDKSKTSLNEKSAPVTLRNKNPGNAPKLEDDYKVSRKEIVSLPKDFNYSSTAGCQQRVVPGRSTRRDVKSDTELYGSVHLKVVLNVLRSNITAEEKLLAIKKSKEYWEKIGTVTEDVPCLSDNAKMGSSIVPGEMMPGTCTASEINLPLTNTPPILIQGTSCDIEDELFRSNIHVTKITLSPETSETEPRFSSIVQQVSLEVNPGIVVDGVEDNERDNDKQLNVRSPRSSLVLHIDTDDLPLSQCSQPPKSPVTVQEWVNSIDLDGENSTRAVKCFSRTDTDVALAPPEHSSVSHESGYHSHTPHESFNEDNLNLGAEARNIDGVVDSSIPEIPSPAQRKESLSPGHHVSLSDFRMKQSSFNSETSTFSTVSSLSSVESLLESRREDPEEILLALGFGSASQDPLARIPHRFLSQPSSARGVDLVTFLRQQEEEFQKQECSCLGYRGLSVSDYKCFPKGATDWDSKSGYARWWTGTKRKSSFKFNDNSQVPASKNLRNVFHKVPEIAITLTDENTAKCIIQTDVINCNGGSQRQETPLPVLTENALQCASQPRLPEWWERFAEMEDLVFGTSSSCSFSSSDTAITVGSQCFRKNIIRSSLV